MAADSKLRPLPASARLALSLLLLVNLGGYAASGLHVLEHHGDRDGRPGLTLDDLTGAYHGIRTRAPLRAALEAGHPGEVEGAAPLPADKRALLLRWLGGDRISEDYDNLDLGAAAPSEVLAAHCLSCHKRASESAGKRLPLEFFDDVKAIAFSRDVPPTDAKILLASTHAHAIALATTTLVLCAFVLLTGFAAALRGGLCLAAALGLTLDLAAWWLARGSAAFVPLIAGGGALHALAVAVMSLVVLVDLWRRWRDPASAA
jgi:hypothetical protein